MHAGFSACVIFKDAGPSPDKLGSSSFQCSAPNKTDSSRQAKAASCLFSPSVWQDQKKRKLFRHWGLSWSGPITHTSIRLMEVCVRHCWDVSCLLTSSVMKKQPLWYPACPNRTVNICFFHRWLLLFPWFDLNIFTDCLSASSRPPTYLCTLGLCSPVYRSRCSLSPTVTLRGPKGPMEGYYYPLSKWTEGDHKTPLLSCSDGNPTPVELFDRPEKWVQESRGLWSPQLRYLQQCQHHARLMLAPLWQSEHFKC